MADPPPYPDSQSDTGVGPDRESTSGLPRWVTLLGIIVAVVALLIVAIMFIGGGEHGPSRHAPSGGAGSQAPPSSVVMEDHTPSEGGHG